MTTISIDENGIWAGSGTLRDGIIEDCMAILGDDQDMAEKAYEAIEQAIADGESSVTIGEYTWTWEITADDTEAYLDAVAHAEQCGTDWRHQYALDHGWDAESIRRTAEEGASDYDREALGERADELIEWCREHQED